MDSTIGGEGKPGQKDATAKPPLFTQPKDEHSADFQLCVSCLVDGCVTAFVELFALSHRDPVCVDPLSNTMFVVPDDKLKWTKEQLSIAEKSRRSGGFGQVYDAYAQMTIYFEDERDHATAQHFHELGLNSAKQSADKNLEGVANENFGNFFERRSDLGRAIEFHEAHLRLAEASRNASMKRRANKNLFRLYMSRAGECEQEGQYGQARELYHKSMETAKSNNDVQAEGEAYHKLGGINVLLGDLERAMTFQKHFLAVAQQNDNLSNEGKAQISLAHLQQEMGRTDEAIKSLERSLQIAQTNDKQEEIREAATKLGLLFNQQGKYVQARHHLEYNFRIARSNGSAESLEESRILYGVARGNYHWGAGYENKVGEQDLSDLLIWQTTGIPDNS